MRCAVLPPFLSSSPLSVGLCRERTEIFCSGRLVTSAQNKRNRGRRNDNGKQLVCWLLVAFVGQNWPVRTPHAVSCSLLIPHHKSTISSIKSLIFPKR